MRHFVISVLCLSFALPGKAQVNNDNVANRIHLVPDGAPLHTTTASATVEWGCLNQALTGKCLVYHNDQWYEFKVQEPQAYFLNISNLVCRNSNGIQIILIEGNPCVTKNYRVLQCIRQIKNEEVFIPLGMVTANLPYLIEIDGFDGDHCDFNIQIARKPSGLPMTFEELQKSDAKISVGSQKDSLVNISWKVPPGLLDQMDQYRVYRLAEGDIVRLERIVPSSKNAYGKPLDAYLVQDTLVAPGNYVYRVIGYPYSGTPLLLTELRMEYVKRKKPPAISKAIVIEPHFSQRVEYAVRVYETEQLSVIHAVNGTYDPAEPLPIKIDMKEFIDKGHRTFMAVLINKVTRESTEYYFRVDERGSIVED